MKKTVKKFLSGISALSVLMVSNTAFVYADETEEVFNNPSYYTFLEENCNGKIPDEEIFLEMYKNEYTSYINIYRSAYNDFDVEGTYYYFEQEHYNNTVLIGNTRLYWGQLTNMNSDKSGKSYTAEEINSFLNENNLNAEVTSIQRKSQGYDYIKLSYDEDVTEQYAADVVVALYQNYGFRPQIYHTNGAYFESEPVTEVTSPIVTFGTPTISGDIDMNGESGIADIVLLTKYTTNAGLFPITDPTALANADVNQDGVVDSLDTSRLIEMALGNYENIV